MIREYIEDNSKEQTAIDSFFAGDLIDPQNGYQECNPHAIPKTAFI